MKTRPGRGLGVTVGGTGVAVGGSGVAIGWAGDAVGCAGRGVGEAVGVAVRVGVGVAVGKGVGVGSLSTASAYEQRPPAQTPSKKASMRASTRRPKLIPTDGLP